MEDHQILFLTQNRRKTIPKTIATGAHFRIKAYIRGSGNNKWHDFVMNTEIQNQLFTEVANEHIHYTSQMGLPTS